MGAPDHETAKENLKEKEAKSLWIRWAIGGTLAFFSVYFFAPYSRLAEQTVESQRAKCVDLITAGRKYAYATSDSGEMEKNRLDFLSAAAKVNSCLAPKLNAAVLVVTKDINSPIADRFKDVSDACHFSYLSALLFEFRREKDCKPA